MYALHQQIWTLKPCLAIFGTAGSTSSDTKTNSARVSLWDLSHAVLIESIKISRSARGRCPLVASGYNVLSFRLWPATGCQIVSVEGGSGPYRLTDTSKLLDSSPVHASMAD